MTNTEIICLFKRTNKLKEKDWVRFCKHYAERDISTVMLFFKDLCKNNGVPLPKNFSHSLKKEMLRTKLKHTCQRISQ